MEFGWLVCVIVICWSAGWLASGMAPWLINRLRSTTHSCHSARNYSLPSYQCPQKVRNNAAKVSLQMEGNINRNIMSTNHAQGDTGDCATMKYIQTRKQHISRYGSPRLFGRRQSSGTDNTGDSPASSPINHNVVREAPSATHRPARQEAGGSQRGGRRPQRGARHQIRRHWGRRGQRGRRQPWPARWDGG